MSLFENEEYQWRETYFVLLDAKNRPLGTELAQALRRLDPRYQVTNVRADSQGLFESLTLISPDDYAAMDITCVLGDEVREQGAELADKLKASASSDELAVIRRIPYCTARIEVYHFEQLVFVGSSGEEGETDDFMDPGALLVVLGKIAKLCDGIVVDPQAGSLL
jgi:hypothetical protein